MGTGGTISAAAASSRRRSPASSVVGVDPIGSLYYDYVKTGRMTKPFAYYVEGIGEDFLPSTMNLKIVDEIVRVDDKECFLMTRELVRAGGPVRGRQLGRGGGGRDQVRRGDASARRTSWCCCPTARPKYLSKIFDDKWMRENGFLDEPDPLGTVAELLRSQEAAPADHGAQGPARCATSSRSCATTASRSCRCSTADGRGWSGIVAEVDLLNHLVQGRGRARRRRSTTLVESRLRDGDARDTHPPAAQHLQRRRRWSSSRNGDAIVGVITKIDLIEYLAERRAR